MEGIRHVSVSTIVSKSHAVLARIKSLVKQQKKVFLRQLNCYEVDPSWPVVIAGSKKNRIGERQMDGDKSTMNKLPGT